MHEETPNKRSAGGARGLEGRYVSSVDVFDLETDRVFAGSWCCIAHIDELKTDSGCRPIRFENQDLLIVKGDDGQVRVFQNFCRHRGSQLVTGDDCPTISKRIQCPYHAWTYDRQGQLIAAPNMDKVEGFEKTEFSLLPCACEEINGLIFITANGPAMEPPVHQLAEYLEAWQVDQLAIAKQIDYEVEANWKLIFQNYSECYHCPTVHPALNQLTPFLGSSNELTEGAVLGGPMGLSRTSETMSSDGKLVGSYLPNLNAEQRNAVFYFTIFPNLFLSFHPDYLLIHRIERIDVARTRVICQFLFPPASFQRPGFDPQRAVEFWDLTNRQDWEVCELAQRGMSNPHYVPGPYSHLESIVAAFDRHYLTMLDERSL